jgi:hypothetical protein
MSYSDWAILLAWATVVLAVASVAVAYQAKAEAA